MKSTIRWIIAPVWVLFIGAAALAGPLTFTTSDLGGGEFEYDFVLTNPFNEPLSGLNIMHANTVFGVDLFSTITSPPGWDVFPPIPGVVDEINWFSLSAPDDVGVHDSKSGYSMVSTRDPSTLGPNDLQYDVIGGDSGLQIAIPDTGRTALLFALGLGAVALMARRARPSPASRLLHETPRV